MTWFGCLLLYALEDSLTIRCGPLPPMGCNPPCAYGGCGWVLQPRTSKIGEITPWHCGAHYGLIIFMNPNTNIGLWISHQKAEIIVAARHQESVSVVWSQPPRTTKGPSPRKLTQFYNQIISRIETASSLLIFGPDDAKSELQLRLDLLKPKARKVDIEDSSTMTPREIMVKVRGHFRPEYQEFAAFGVNTP